MPSAAAQKAAVANFVHITGANDRTAREYLKGSSYKLNEAVDAFFQGRPGSSSSPANNKETQLNKMFDGLRNDKDDAKDVLGADSAMKYLTDIKVNMEDASLLAAVELVQAPSIGEIRRAGFVSGWKEAGVDASKDAQEKHFKRLVKSMGENRDLFRKVYRYTFVAGKEGDQRALSLDLAMAYWEILFKKPGHVWEGSTSGIVWFDEYTTFLQENWKRSVSRDMWNQTLEFAFKSTDDDTLNFYSEESSWPGVIDEFVAWYKKKSAMDVDA